tara:strand:+ start:11082 stop:12308 length:1227 start_codon:yes stop_codon:yes gene_type:complete
MASWKKVIVSGSAAVLDSLTLDTPLAAGYVATLNQDTTGKAATADILTTARTIGGVSFNGGSNINLPGVNAAGNQDTTGNAGTATALETARTIASQSFDGTGNITLNNSNITNGAGYITSATDTVDMGDGFVIEDADGTEVTITENKEIKFSGTGGLTINFTDTTPGSDADPFDLQFAIGTLNQDTTGNAATATKIDSITNSDIVQLTAVQELTNKTIAASQITEISNITAGEGAQLENINSVTITNTQWGYLGAATGAITNTDVNVSTENLKTALADGFALNAVQIGDADDIVTIGNKLVVTGDLQVNGTTTTVDTTNLNVTDQFINLNDGGGAADGGIVVEGAGVSYGWDNSAGRWAFLSTGATEGQTSIAQDAFAAAVVVDDNVAAYRKNGNIRVESNDIWIYVE